MTRPDYPASNELSGAQIKFPVAQPSLCMILYTGCDRQQSDFGAQRQMP